MSSINLIIKQSIDGTCIYERVLNLISRGPWFEPHLRYCVVSLSKTLDPHGLVVGPCARHIYPCLVLVQPRKTRPYITEILLMGRKESNQTKKITAVLVTTQEVAYNDPNCPLADPLRGRQWVQLTLTLENHKWFRFPRVFHDAHFCAF